jgi:hypothetical protein
VRPVRVGRIGRSELGIGDGGDDALLAAGERRAAETDEGHGDDRHPQRALHMEH